MVLSLPRIFCICMVGRSDKSDKKFRGCKEVVSNCPVKTVAMFETWELMSDGKVVVGSESEVVVLMGRCGLLEETVCSTDIGTEPSGVSSSSLAEQESELRGDALPEGGDPGAEMGAGVSPRSWVCMTLSSDLTSGGSSPFKSCIGDTAITSGVAPKFSSISRTFFTPTRRML